MDSKRTLSFVELFWDDKILPAIQKYIEVPNLSPLFDPEWETNGHLANAVNLVREWIEAQNVRGAKVEVLSDPGHTPLLFIEVEGTSPGTVLLYGHLDKQPHMSGWEEGLGPTTPVIRDGKLYGRGGADDGYAAFACIGAIKALQEQNAEHARLVVIIECSEESGSYDLPHYIQTLAPRIGTPDLVICLDSGCGNYDQLWLTTSLRGSVVGNLTVEVLTEGVHSGDASGIVPSSVRILRQLLDRLEDSKTGRLKPKSLYVKVPAQRMKDLRGAAKVIGHELISHFPWSGRTQPVVNDVKELLLNRTWRPTVSYTGQEGLPDLVIGGNVLRPYTSLKLSIRVPPTLDAAAAEKLISETLTADPPYGATVRWSAEKSGTGWQAPEMAKWLQKSVNAASKAFFGRPAMSFGEGGSIPFMGMLGEKFPDAQFVITGVLGPKSNAHGPNEFLHLGMAKRLTASMARVIADQARSRS